MMRSGQWINVAALMSSALLLAGCSGADMPNMGDLSDQVADAVEDRGIERPDSVGCGGQVALSAGMQLNCDLQYQERGDLVAEISLHRVGSDGLGFDMDIVDENGDAVETD